MAHIHEKIDFCVEAFIVYKNKVLLRMHDKYNFWCSVGGHIELDEDPFEALLREVKEEVGLEVEIISDVSMPESYNNNKYIFPPRYISRHKINDIHEHVALVYFVKSKNNNVSESILEHEKHAEIKWCTAEDLENMDLRSDIKFSAQKALKELGEK